MNLITVYRIHKKYKNGRVSYLQFSTGMWYDTNGREINVLNTDNMPYDPLREKNAHSCVSTLEDIPKWFSKDQLQFLLDNGYGLYKYESNQNIILPTETLILFEGIDSVIEMSLSELIETGNSSEGKLLLQKKINKKGMIVWKKVH